MNEDRVALPEKRNCGTIGYYAVGVFDLLGMSGRLNKLVHPLPTDEYKKSFCAEMKRVDCFRKLFVGHFRGNPSHSSSRDSLPLDRQEKLKWALDNDVGITAFSDTVIAYCPLLKNGQPSALGLRAMIGAAGATLLLLLSENIPLRGGIEIAAGTEPWEGEIFGPAIALAHDLERKAGWPRILVGENAVQFLTDCQRNNNQDFFAKFNRELANECSCYIGMDEEDNHFVDYLNAKFQSAMGGFDKEIPKALRFVQQEKSRFNVAEDDKHTGRYDKLERYFSSSGSTSIDRDST